MEKDTLKRWQSGLLFPLSPGKMIKNDLKVDNQKGPSEKKTVPFGCLVD
jgi:hypothetical protein